MAHCFANSIPVNICITSLNVPANVQLMDAVLLNVVISNVYASLGVDVTYDCFGGLLNFVIHVYIENYEKICTSF